MANKKNILLFALLSALVILQAVVANLNIKLWLKITLSVLVYASVLVALILHAINFIKKLQQKNKEEQVIQTPKPVVPTFLDMYAILKIPPQYNPDGTLKDMYQLLGIEPQYDQDGNRILTIYEKLGINPRFDANGNELPTVVRIKNRVNSIIKLQAAPEPLIYITREQKISGNLPYLPVPDLTEKPVTEVPQFKKIPIVKVQTTANKKSGGGKSSVNYGKVNYKVSVSGSYKIVTHSATSSLASGSPLNWGSKNKQQENFAPKTATPPQNGNRNPENSARGPQINSTGPIIIKTNPPKTENGKESGIFGSFEFE